MTTAQHKTRDVRQLLATVGYEMATITSFITTLNVARIETLIDVREIAMSRRKGFAKRALSAALGEAGIAYVHLPGLGDPKAGRVAARAGDLTRFRRVFKQHLKTETAQADLLIACDLVREGNACLLCYERDHAVCHRSMIAEAVAARVAVTVLHLEVENSCVDDSRASASRRRSEQRA